MDEIADGVYHWTNVEESPWRMLYVFENTTASSYDIVLDWTGSANIKMDGSTTSLKETIALGPYQRRWIALLQVSLRERAAICFDLQIHMLDHKSMPLSVEDLAAHSTFSEKDAKSTLSRDQTTLKLTWKHLSTLYERHSPVVSSHSESRVCSGDAAFVSDALRTAFQYLAERREVLLRLFRPTNANDRYEVALYRHGMPQTVVVDGFIPCVVNGGAVLLKSVDRELWPLLLHQALAKLYDGYMALLDLSLGQLVEDIFGHSTIQLATPQKDRLDDFRHQLASLIRSRHLVGMTSPTCGSLAVVSVDLDDSQRPARVDFKEMGSRDVKPTVKTMLFESFASNIMQAWFVPIMTPAKSVVRRFFIEKETLQTTDATTAATFVLSVQNSTTATICFTFHAKMLLMGLSILKVLDNYGLEEIATSCAENWHSCSVFVQLEAGEYMIALQPPVFDEIDTQPHHATAESVEQQLQQFFKVLDWDMDNRLNLHDMERFMTLYEDKLSLSRGAFDWLLEHYDSDSVGLTEQGLLEYYLANIDAAKEATDDFIASKFQQAHACILHVQTTHET
ncbi:hypothetical protein AC1031_004504 [Aphanomyces cochlioides]|nr:hypothetical protein AC1031_004504 [Aphanomyces cochlioides]